MTRRTATVMRIPPTTTFLLTPILLGIAGCGGLTDQEPGSGDQAHEEAEYQEASLVATLDHPSGNQFRFFQGGDGPILVRESGAIDSRPIGPTVPSDLPTVVDVYQYLAPAKEVPRGLLDAQARFEKAERLGRFDSRGPGMSRVETVEQGVSAGVTGGDPEQTAEGFDRLCPGEWFRTNHCESNSSCYVHVTGNFRKSGGDRDIFRGTVCPYRGSVAVSAEWKVCFLCTGYKTNYSVNQGRWEQLTIHKFSGPRWQFEYKFNVTGGSSGYNANTWSAP